MLGVGAGGPVSSSGGPVAAGPEGRTRGRAPDGHRPSDAAVTDPYGSERDAWTALASAHGLGPVGFAALLAEFGTGRAIMEVAAGPSGVERLLATRPVRADRGDGGPIHASVARAIVSAVENADQTVSRVRALGVRVVT